jgi:hypothetical protein
MASDGIPIANDLKTAQGTSEPFGWPQKQLISLGVKPQNVLHDSTLRDSRKTFRTTVVSTSRIRGTKTKKATGSLSPFINPTRNF